MPGKRTHHIYMVEADFSEHWKRLPFRGYLIEHAPGARDHKQLKLKHAAEALQDRFRYTQGKTNFIQLVKEKAKHCVATFEEPVNKST